MYGNKNVSDLVITMIVSSSGTDSVVLSKLTDMSLSGTDSVVLSSLKLKYYDK
jgi:hypothetical protein